jgi:thiamine-phosphate pyrophosphorylase
VDADASGRAGIGMVQLAEAFLAGGARFLQLRAKQLSGRDLMQAAAAIVERAHARGAIVVVNDRADIARLTGADGVHVGQTDLAPADVRTIVGATALVGLSTHSVAQVEAARREPVSYVAIGPVFASDTKATGYEALGIDRVREVAERAHESGLPVVAIGGVTLDRAPEVLRAGADAVAVIGDLLTGGDPVSRVRNYVRTLP